MAAAQVFVDQDAAAFEAQPGVVIASSEITSLELEARYPDLLPGADVEIWRLEYRLLPADMAQVAITGGRETDGQGGITEYTAQGRPYLVLSTAPDGSYTYLDVLWSTAFTGDAADLQRRVTELAYGVPDLEYALTREGYNGWYGLGGPDVGFLEGEPAVEPLDYDVTYGEGDRWEKRTWEGLTAEFYVSAEYGPRLHALSTTLPDLSTYRGVSVGDTHAQVREAYPEIHSEPIWDYTGDYLWYGGDMAFGPLLFFYFDGDAVSHIDLVTILD